MFSKFIFAAILIITNTSLYAQTKVIFTSHAQNEVEYSDFAIITDSSTNRNYILFLTYYKDDMYKSILSVYDDKNSLIFKQKFLKFILLFPSKSGCDKQLFMNNKFYFVDDKYLYKLDIKNTFIDSIKLPVSKYSGFNGHGGLYYYEQDNHEYLLYDYNTGVDLYKLNPLKLFKEFEKDFTNKGYGGMPILLKDKIIFTNKKNEVICKNIKDKKTIWTFNSGETDVSFLGINIGSVPDYISEYSFINDDPKELFMSTLDGDLIKIDVNTGTVNLKKESFRGDNHENFAGKLTYIVQYDMNRNSTTDFVCTSADKNLYVINGKDFSVLWFKEFDSKLYNPFSLYDINNDNIPEVFIYIDSYLYILNGKDGKVIYNLKISDEKFYGSRIILGNFNNNGKLNIILNSTYNKIKILEMENVNIPRGMMIMNK